MPVITAPARLDLLLPWLNGAFDEHVYEGHNPEPVAVRTDYAAIRRAIANFVKSFDGSTGAGYVVVEPDDTVDAIDDETIDALQAGVTILLEQGLGEPSLQKDCALPLDSLRMAVQGAGRWKPKRRGGRVVGGRTALHTYRAAGAYVLRTHGPIAALVPFLVAHLLTAPGMVAMKQCLRPGCTHLIVAAPGPGAPQKFCSKSCRAWNAELKQQRTRSRK